MNHDDYIPRDRDTLAALGMEDVSYGNWARSECFKVEKGLLSYGYVIIHMKTIFPPIGILK